MSLQLSGAEIILKSLRTLEVKYTFGMPGSQNIELFDAITDSSVKNILVTNELSAAFMADGYYRATGKPGICISVSGPGITYMVSGLAEAYADSAAMIVFVISSESSDKKFRIHELDQNALLEPVVKKIFKINDASELSDQIYEAWFFSQTGEPGPVVIDISKDILRSKAEYKELDREKYYIRKADDYNDKISAIFELVTKAELCGIYAGAGALSSASEIIEISEKFSLPVATTISGKGVIPEDNEFSVGFGFGPSGTKLAEDIFNKCDVILALGCKFSEMATGNWGMKIPGELIHVNTDKSVFDKNYPARISLCADVHDVLKDILDSAKRVVRKKNIELIEKIHKEKYKFYNKTEKVDSLKGIHPSKVFKCLRKIITGDTILTTDCGNHQLWAISDHMVREPRTFITPADYQAMGYGLPAAIGAKLGCPEKKTVCISGDGGFLMSGFEILTAVREKINIAVIIFNDSSLGLIKGLQNTIYGRTSSVELQNPDYERLSAAFNMDYIKIKSADELEKGLIEMWQNKKVILVDIDINYSDLPRYIKGSGKTAWNRSSLTQKMQMITRRVKRLLS